MMGSTNLFRTNLFRNLAISKESESEEPKSTREQLDSRISWSHINLKDIISPYRELAILNKSKSEKPKSTEEHMESDFYSSESSEGSEPQTSEQENGSKTLIKRKIMLNEPKPEPKNGVSINKESDSMQDLSQEMSKSSLDRQESKTLTVEFFKTASKSRSKKANILQEDTSKSEESISPDTIEGNAKSSLDNKSKVSIISLDSKPEDSKSISKRADSTESKLSKLSKEIINDSTGKNDYGSTYQLGPVGAGIL